MMSSTNAEIMVFTIDDSSSLKELASRVRQSSGPCMVVLSPAGLQDMDEHARRLWLRDLASLHNERLLFLATKHRPTQLLASEEGWKVLTSVRQLKMHLKNHASYHVALRNFSPDSWREHIRTHLQSTGFLSLPKFRIWLLLLMSIFVFLFVFFRLLPSCTIKVWPSENTVSFTTNLYLVSSGAVLPVPSHRIHSIQLFPLTVSIDRSLTFDQISKNFTGKSAEMLLNVFNDGDQSFSLRKRTRFANQAGMVFRLQQDLILTPHSHQRVKVVADVEDLYGEIVGKRGNVPAGIKWDVLGLSNADRAHIYGRNETPAIGGTTSYVNIVKKEDIALARKQLEQELLSSAKQTAEDRLIEMSEDQHRSFVQLRYDDLTKIVFKDFHLSEEFIGQDVRSFPIQGTVDYTVLLYDEDSLLSLMKQQILGHVSSDKVIKSDSLSKINLDIRIIPPWDDNFRWVKVTSTLTYVEKYILNSLTPQGAQFAKSVRDSVMGKSITEASAIIKNLQQVSKVSIRMWPPWVTILPTLSTSIAVIEQ